MNIGFIGLGNMGLPMAANLAAAGNLVTGFDQVAAACDQAAQKGIKIAASAADAVAGAELIITMLPSGPIVLSVLEEILPAAKAGAVIVDCSTIDVSSARQAHEMAEKHRLGCLDAPVSGGIGGAAAGTLTFMIGGSEQSLEAAKPALEIMGGRSVPCGPGGAGQSAKICNNMLLAISMIGACEAFTLADHLGLDQQALFDVISTSSGYCWSVNVYCPVPGVGPQSPADNDYKPGFASALMVKDLGLSQQAAAETGAPTPMGAHAAEYYRQFVDAGGGEVDFGGIIRHLEYLRKEG